MMFWTDLKFPPPFCHAVFIEHLTTLSVHPRDNDSHARYFASLKFELGDEKSAQKVAKDKV
jgi:hypothetical protein